MGMAAQNESEIEKKRMGCKTIDQGKKKQKKKKRKETPHHWKLEKPKDIWETPEEQMEGNTNI